MLLTAFIKYKHYILKRKEDFAIY